MTNGNRKIKSAAREIVNSTNLKYTEALRLAETLVPESDEARRIVEALVAGQDCNFEIKTGSGLIEDIQIVGEEINYNSTDNPTYANIVTTEHVHVCAWDEGTQFEYRFKDGGERTTWVVPLINNEDLAVDHISSVEFDALEALDSYLHDTFFSDNIPKEVKAVIDAPVADGETEQDAADRSITATATFIVNALMKRRREVEAAA